MWSRRLAPGDASSAARACPYKRARTRWERHTSCRSPRSQRQSVSLLSTPAARDKNSKHISLQPHWLLLVLDTVNHQQLPIDGSFLRRGTVCGRLDDAYTLTTSLCYRSHLVYKCILKENALCASHCFEHKGLSWKKVSLCKVLSVQTSIFLIGLPCATKR